MYYTPYGCSDLNYTTLPQNMQNQLAYQAQLDVIKTNHEMAKELEKAEIAVRKNEVVKGTNIDAETTLLKIREDVRTRRELMKTDFELDSDGSVRISQQMFGGEMKDTSPFKIWDVRLLKNSSTEEEILTFIYELQTGKRGTVSISVEQIDERYVNKKFTAAGLSFGFSHGKESAMHQKLVAKLISVAPVKILPLTRGWYEYEGRPKFCFPEDFTFEEARKNV